MTFIPDEIARVDPGTFQRTWGAWCGGQGYRCDLIVRQHSMQEPAKWVVLQFDAQLLPFGPPGWPVDDREAFTDEDLDSENYRVAANANLRLYGWEIEAAELTPVGADEMLDLAAAAQGET